MVKERFTTEDMRDMIYAVMLSPGFLSKQQRRAIRAAFDGGNIEQQQKIAEELLEQMCAQDLFLGEDLEEFTAFRSCRVSLIRDGLLQVWERGKLATQPIAVVQELEAVA